MIDVNEASGKAIDHLKKLYPDQDLGKVLFEEAELTDDDKFWIITLSYKTPVAAGGLGQSMFVGVTGVTRYSSCWPKTVKSVPLKIRR
jgi:hypothetical protein